jgi:hypothetical protein
MKYALSILMSHFGDEEPTASIALNGENGGT